MKHPWYDNENHLNKHKNNQKLYDENRGHLLNGEEIDLKEHIWEYGGQGSN